jgi:hypothetical protein
MTADVLFTVIAFALGWGLLRCFATATGWAFAAAASYPLGVAIWAVAGVMLMASQITFHPLGPVVLAIIVLTLVNWRWGSRPNGHELTVAGFAAATVTLAAAAFAYLEWIVFNYDALWTFYMADDIFYRGAVSDGTRKFRLSAEPIYLPMVSAFAVSMGEIYFKSLQPLMAASGVVLLQVLGRRALAPPGMPMSARAIWLPALAAIALATTIFYVECVLQVKNHGAYALHMLVACAALYFAASERITRWFVLALVFVAPLVLVRHETGIAALAILVVAVAIPNVPLRTRLLGVGGVAVAWGFSYLYLLGATTYFDGFVRALVYKKLIWIGAPPGIFGVLLLVAAAWRRAASAIWLERAVAALPMAMIATLIAVLAGHATVKPDVVAGSLRGAVAIFADPSLGATGYGVAVVALFLLAPFAAPRVPAAWIILVPSVAYLIVLALTDVHLDGFPHWGPGASLTRMMSHVLPTLLFYVLVRYAAPDRSIPARAAAV